MAARTTVFASPRPARRVHRTATHGTAPLSRRPCRPADAVAPAGRRAQLGVADRACSRRNGTARRSTSSGRSHVRMWAVSSTISARPSGMRRRVGARHVGRGHAVAVAGQQQRRGRDAAQLALQVEAHEGAALGRVARRVAGLQQADEGAELARRALAEGRRGAVGGHGLGDRGHALRLHRLRSRRQAVATGLGQDRRRPEADQRRHPVGMAGRVAEHDRAAHGVAHQGHPAQPELVHQGGQVVDQDVDRVRPGRHLAGARPAQVVRHHAEVGGQRRDLAVPDPVRRAAQPVHQDERRAVTVLGDGQPHAVDVHVRH